jgi:4-hydroxy-3-methylbut-2-enyl diphosphate reductase
VVDIFRDPEVDVARQQGGEIELAGGRRLLLPRVFGFCAGVVHALAMLDRCLEARAGRTVYLLGPVIHNDTVNDWFRAQGVAILAEDRIADILHIGTPEDIVVIPAFGVPVDLAEALAQRYRPEQILDTTCRDVRALWRFLAGLDGPDWTVLIHGKPDHPETRATLSRALRCVGRVVLVRDVADVEGALEALQSGAWSAFPAEQRHETECLPGPAGPVALVNQTTMLHSETMAVAAMVQAACRQAGRVCRLADSVCRATQDRQDAAREICRRRPDVMVVVGGFGSSNTAQLYRLAREAAPAFLVRNATALAAERVTHWLPGMGLQQTAPWLPKDWRQVGLLAGASCPARDVGDAIRWFRQLATAQARDSAPAPER